MKYSDCALFNKMDNDSTTKMISNAIKMMYKKDQYIHFNSDYCDSIDIIIEGIVEIEHLNEDGQKMIMKLSNPLDIIGLNIIFSKNPYYIMNFIARTDVKILHISKKSLLEESKNNVQLMNNIFELLSENSMLLGYRFKNEFKITIREKLMNYFTKLHRIQKTVKVKLPLTKTELASMLGVHRTSLSREIKHMIDQSLIHMDFNVITLNFIDKKEQSD